MHKYTNTNTQILHIIIGSFGVYVLKGLAKRWVIKRWCSYLETLSNVRHGVDREQPGRQNSTISLKIVCFISWHQGGPVGTLNIDIYNAHTMYIVVSTNVHSPVNGDNCSSRFQFKISTGIDAKCLQELMQLLMLLLWWKKLAYLQDCRPLCWQRKGRESTCNYLTQRGKWW